MHGHRHSHWRRRARRGNLRAAILLLLEEEPRNGYQLIQELDERSDSAWRPSPGSVYPALQLLTDEGLIRGTTEDGSTVYELTEAGRKHVEEQRESFGTPWQEAGVPDDVRKLMRVGRQVVLASRQVLHAGSEAQRKAATELLEDTRRRLYGILAENGS